MVSNEERRGIARKAREQVIDEAAFTGCVAADVIGADYYHDEECWRRLADLIDPGEDVSVSAYDLLPEEEREAIRWVREHGGLDALRHRVDVALAREVVAIGACSLLGMPNDSGARDVMHALKSRLMPEGMEWPTVDGKPVDFVTGYEPSLGALEAVSIYSNGACEVMGHDGIIKDVKEIHVATPKVLDADGVEIRVGDTVYHVKDGSEMTVYGIEGEWLVVSVGGRVRHDIVTHRAPVIAADGRPLNKGDRVRDVLGNRRFEVLEIDGEGKLGEYVVKTKGADGIGLTGWSRPCDLTHHYPVTGADGKPLREGEHVYHVETGAELVVKELPRPGEYQAVVMFAPSSGHLTSFDPDLLTHERPDTWELLEEDVANASCPDVYCANHRIDASDTSYEWAMARDIVRPRQGAGGGRVMRYVSTFSGIEAASVAWGPLGWEPIAFSEIEPFPCAVLAERFPNVPNLGDVTEIEWRRFARKHGKPDIVVGGSPCQSFSVAGGREGLDGASGLMWEYVRCVRELMPRWLLWENVPGALSSSHGEDFRCLLESLDGLGYGLAWRVLDAQFFGVAQRRRRVFLVGRLGDPDGPCKVLFEPDCLRWDTGSSQEKRKALAGAAAGGTGSAGFGYKVSRGAGSVGYREGQYPTLLAGRQDACVLAVRTAQGGSNGMGVSEGLAHTVDCSGPEAICMTDTQPRATVDGELMGALSATMFKDPPVVCYSIPENAVGRSESSGTNGPMAYDETYPSPTLRVANKVPSVCFAANQRGEVRLQGGDGDATGATPASQSGKQVMGVADGFTLRRLTPRECERLQGFPDDWTLVPYRGKPADECPDGPRYKAIGNSMAVPVMRWIGERIQMVERSSDGAHRD